MFKLRICSIFISLLIIGFSSCKHHTGETDERPNIVFIMADDMGYGDVSCYNNQSKIPTPNIDRLASEGILFTDAHAPAALCSPTRYGLLTGRYCWRTRLNKGVLIGYDETPLIEQGRNTIASVLKQKGYYTACIGKWHVGLTWPTKDGCVIRDDENKWQEYGGVFKENEDCVDFSEAITGGPVDLGFDYFFGTAGCSTSDPPYVFIENRHTVVVPTMPSTEELHKLPGFMPGLMDPDWSEEDVDLRHTEKAIEFIHRHVKEQHDAPFFLYVALSSPHIPFLVPDLAKGKSEEGPRGDLVVVVDWCTGEILKALEEHNLSENTLVIVTSDNGPRKGANGHKSAGEFRGRKAQIWEGGHRVPFIARWPGKIEPGTTTDATISLTDMFATFASLVHHSNAEGGEDSYNILPALLGEETTNTEDQVRIFHSGSADFAIRKGKWKLILNIRESGLENQSLPPGITAPTGQLFDLSTDPYETNDLWDQEPGVVEELLEIFNAIQ